MSTTSVNELLGQAQNFLNKEEQWALVESLMVLLKGAEPKSKPAKAQRKPRGPVSEDSFIHFSNRIVLPILKALAQEKEEAERKQMMGVSGKAGVSALLWAKLKELPSEERIEAMAEVTEDQVTEAYETWKATPRDSDSGSVKSKASKASKVELSDEEKAAKKAATNEKRKATREANKAAKAASESGSEAEKKTEAKPKEEPKAAATATKPKKVVKPKTEATKTKVAGPEFTDEQISWCDEKGREYLVLEHNMWDANTSQWVGKWDAKANKIDTTAKEPELEDD
jgi:hypothetical protein